MASVVCWKWGSLSSLYFLFILRFCQFFLSFLPSLSQLKNKPFSAACNFLGSNALKNIFCCDETVLNSILGFQQTSAPLLRPLRLEVQCEVVDSEINHILPAFSVVRRECGLQREPLLFSCAGHSPKYRRLCPCRDFRYGQVALCRDCL